ncbi:hypothetical protein [Planotetraspora mira]|uniref:hypothetical protein n=1 Tax=Planotetraspora mira TaxID=58121 RepID=UPI0019520F28|nr:hypothetical protein [Planotetraspora mira]
MTGGRISVDQRRVMAYGSSIDFPTSTCANAYRTAAEGVHVLAELVAPWRAKGRPNS